MLSLCKWLPGSTAWRRAFGALWLTSFTALGAPPFLDARADALAQAEQLVQVPRFEGITQAEVEALGPRGVAHLARMLADPKQAPHHARILEVLGRRGGATAYRAVARHAATDPTGEVADSTFRSQIALRFAMGRLAREQDGAFTYLLLRASPEAPRWSSRSARGDALRRLLHECTVTALALSGRPEAEAVLRGMLVQAREPMRNEQGPGWEERLVEALALHRERRGAR